MCLLTRLKHTHKQKKKTLPTSKEVHKKDQIAHRKINMRDCSEFSYSKLNKHKELNNCFMLSTVLNSVQEAERKSADTFMNYIETEEQSIFNSRVAIVHTISKDCAIKKCCVNCSPTSENIV